MSDIVDLLGRLQDAYQRARSVGVTWAGAAYSFAMEDVAEVQRVRNEQKPITIKWWITVFTHAAKHPDERRPPETEITFTGAVAALNAEGVILARMSAAERAAYDALPDDIRTRALRLEGFRAARNAFPAGLILRQPASVDRQAADLVSDLSRRGIGLSVVGDTIRVTGSLTESDRENIVRLGSSILKAVTENVTAFRILPKE